MSGDVNCQFSPPHGALALHDKVQYVTYVVSTHIGINIIRDGAPPDRPHYCFISQPTTKLRPVRRPVPQSYILVTNPQSQANKILPAHRDNIGRTSPAPAVDWEDPILPSCA